MIKRLLIILLLCSTVFGVNTAITSFNAGEFSPLLFGQTGLAKYYSGCQTLENMLVMSYGGATRRPGSKYIAEVKDSTAKVRLVSFEFSTEQAYVIEFGNLYARYYANGEQLTAGGGTEDISGLDNIIAHWLMNDDTGNTVVLDDDGATHNGVSSTNTEDIHAVGKVGTGSFDLDSQYAVSVADHADFSFIEGVDGDFSITGWAYISDTGTDQTIISKWDETAGSKAREWKLFLDSTRHLNLTLADESILLDSDAISQWKMNDSLQTDVVLDAIGSHNGALTDGVNNYTSDHSVAGITGNAFDFDGTNDVVTVPSSPDFSFGDGTNDSRFSISAWVNMDDATNFELISKLDSAGVAEWRFYLDAADKLRVDLFDDSSAVFISRYYNTALTAYQTGGGSAGWAHLAMTYDATEAPAGISLYLNGTAVDDTSIAGAYTAMHDEGADIRIGLTPTVAYAEGDIDNTIIFNKELSQAEVTALYNSGSGKEDLGSDVASIVTDDAIGTGWRYIASTYDGVGGATAMAGAILYVDSLAVDTTVTETATYVAMEDTAAVVRIGSQFSSAGAIEKIWADKLDDTAVFGDVLTPTEVASLYDATAVYEIATPYLTADLFGLQFIQSADVMFIAHPDYHPMQLTRSNDTDWTIAELVFERGPFVDENETETTITPSATTGDGITLTASSNVFNNPGHIGALFEIAYDIPTVTTEGSFAATGQSSTLTVQLGRSWAFSTGGTWNGTVELQKSYDSGTLWSTVAGQVYPGSARNVSSSGTEIVDDAIYRVNMTEHTSGTLTYNFTSNGFQLNGVVEITAVASATSATADVQVDLGGTSATKIWSEGAWSDLRGYPSTLAFFEERLTFGATTYQPQTVWLSETDAWTSFRNDTGDSDAMTFTIASDQVNAIRWMIPKTRLILGTSGGEWTIGSNSADKGLTPTDVKAVRHSTYGSAELQAIAVNNVVLFPQSQARKIRELTYSFEIDDYVSPDMTVLSEHITEGGIVDMAYQSIPDSILWNVLGSGNLAAMTYNREQNVIGWHRHVTDGTYESVAVIPGTEDEVWVSVLRTIDGSPVRYVEQFQPRDYGDDQDDAFYVDSGFTYDGVATVTITGLDHLEGETVNVLGDGLLQADKTVGVAGGFAAGAITITSASTVQVGMPYTSTVSPMPLNVPMKDGTMMGRTIIVRDLVMRFNETSACNAGPTTDKYTPLVFDTIPFTGNEQVTWKGSYDTEANIVLFTDDPLPLTILSLMPSFEVGN